MLEKVEVENRLMWEDGSEMEIGYLEDNGKLAWVAPIFLDYELRDNGYWYVNFECDAMDETSGMDKVEMYINDVWYETIFDPGPYEFIVEWSNDLFKVIFKFVAYDMAGNSIFDIIDGEDITSLPHSQFTIKQINILII